jgi:hypothetical protein
LHRVRNTVRLRTIIDVIWHVMTRLHSYSQCPIKPR